MMTGVGEVTAKKLLANFGSPEAVLNAGKIDLGKAIGNSVAKNIDKHKIIELAKKELEFVEKNDIKFLFYTDNDYPYKLKQCEDAPVAIYVKGTADLNNLKAISIVGTRSASNYGISLCKKLIEDIANKGYKPIIISGLAYGIDICAHTTAMANKLDTAAVMGTSLKQIYPAAHRSIAKQIEKQGALVTEYTTNSPIVPSNFVNRNRIIAGLADVVIIVESSKKGGALITAYIANGYNRDVMAFPGRVGDQSSQGCNHLIKSNKAALIESVEDLEYQMNWSIKPQKQQKLSFVDLTEPEQSIINLLKSRDSENIDTISKETGIALPELAAFLLNMEFAGYIKLLPGHSYSLSI